MEMGKSMEENIGIKLCKFMKTQLEKQYAGLKEKIEMQRAWKYLGKVLVEALSDKFVDLLYLEETEKEITDVRTGVTGNLVKHFVGELLDEKWLMDCYANKVLEKCGFPERKILLYMSAQLYERRPVKARIYFSDRSLKTMVHDMGKESEKKPVSFIRLETEDADKGLEMLEYKINLDNLRIIRK